MTTETRPKRGRDVRKMDKPYTCREVLHTCSNGWTIERVPPEDENMEGFFMGHCLGIGGAGRQGDIFSLREPDGTPHVTIVHHVMVGRCNQAPKEKYAVLCREFVAAFKSVKPTQYQLAYRRPDGV